MVFDFLIVLRDGQFVLFFRAGKRGLAKGRGLQIVSEFFYVFLDYFFIVVFRLRFTRLMERIYFCCDGWVSCSLVSGQFECNSVFFGEVWLVEGIGGRREGGRNVLIVIFFVYFSLDFIEWLFFVQFFEILGVLFFQF